MKNILFLVLFSLPYLLFSHGNHGNNKLKSWNFNNRESIEASFFMYKDSLVTLELSNHDLLHIPLTDFSDKDQYYIQKKIENISNINQNNKLTNSTIPLKIDSAFAPFKPSISTYWDNTYFYVESLGLPSHKMMVGIADNGWQQQVPITQCYILDNAWSIPLNPVIANTPIPVDDTHFTRGAIAIAVNGIPIFNPYTNTGVDAYLDGQLDNFGGHCGRADDYHYHTAPLHLSSQTSSNLPIAYALDGFPVYGELEPDNTLMYTLDGNNGHFDANGDYHYHGVQNAPYMIANMVGVVTEDASNQIIPQASSTSVRPFTSPLNGALITDCIPNATNNGYLLTYTYQGNGHEINYDWDASGTFTYTFSLSTGFYNEVYNSNPPCNIVTEIKEETMFNQLKVIDIVDVLGRKTKPKKNILLFYIYNDGTVEKKIILE